MKLLFVSPVSACFELENQHPYYAPEPYSVFLDGVLQFRRDTNVFSLFHLRPNTAYCVRAGEQELHFTTKAVTAAVSVRDFGAVGDGVQDDTAAIQTAILCLPEGGLLHFPEGTYRTSPLTLKSHITLSMGQGAVLLGETDRARYPEVPGKIQDLFTGCGISLLHSKRHIRDSGTVIRQHHDNFIRKDIYFDDTTVCMDYHIDFSFIHGNGTAADDICIQVH